MNFTNFRLYYLFLFVCLITTACKKDNSQSNTVDIQAVVSGSVPYIQASGLYISGYTLLHDTVYAANVWKDGAVFSLPTVNGGCSAITAQGSDVYVAGISKESKLLYWKNGVAAASLSLPANLFSYAISGIFVQGSDVYVSGTIQLVKNYSIPVYWKNGVINYLYNDRIFLSGSSTSGLVIVGTDVYVSGSRGGYGIYWKNGIVNGLYNCNSTTGIAVAGTDIYIVGTAGGASTTSSPAAYWKNGNPVYLTNNGNTAVTANAIAVHGSDVYVTGTIYNKLNNEAAYWKNGVINNLTTSAYQSLTANAICTDSNNNVYVAGTVYLNYQPVAAFWKNGIVTVLSNTTYSHPTGIVYVP